MNFTVHQNASLTVEGRKRSVERCHNRPSAHVAAEMGISRATASKWVDHDKKFGEIGLVDRSTTPLRQLTATGGETVVRVERMCGGCKWSMARIEFGLTLEGTVIGRRTVSCSGTCTTITVSLEVVGPGLVGQGRNRSTGPTAHMTDSHSRRQFALPSTTSGPHTSGHLSWVCRVQCFPGPPCNDQEDPTTDQGET